MTKLFKRFLMVLLASTLATSALATAPAEQTFVQGLGEKALSILANKSVTKEQANATFKQMLNDNFDLPAIGRFVLGRYWNVATPVEQQEYMQLFNRMVEKIYLDRFGLYSGEGFNVTGMRPDAQGTDKMVTSQVVRPQGPPVNVEWRVRDAGAGKFKIVDVIVEGVSMSVTQRAEFSSVIQRGGGTVESLLVMLRERTAVIVNNLKAN